MESTLLIPSVINNAEAVTVLDTDSIRNLQLYHYVNCTVDTPDDIAQIRGVIKRGDKILCKRNGFIPELTATDNLHEIQALLKDVSFSECTFQKSYEGCTVSLWYDPEFSLSTNLTVGESSLEVLLTSGWTVSTSKKIDAFSSRWSSPVSFGEMFIEGLAQERFNSYYTMSTFLSQINKERVYNFVVLNSFANRIVSYPPRDTATIFHAGEYNVSNNFMLTNDNTSGVQSVERYTFDSISNLLNVVEELNPFESQGIIVTLPNKRQLKIVNSNYTKLAKIRDNEPNLKTLYLKNIHNPEQLSRILELYPYIPHYEDILESIKQNVYDKYVKRFILNPEKKIVTVPKYQYFLVRYLHSAYLYDRYNNKVTYELVSRLIDALPTPSLLGLVNGYEKNTFEHGDGNWSDDKVVQS